MNFLHLLDEKISRVEQLMIAALLTVMILLAFSQIVLRNFFATGIDWADSLVRYLVVWVGFLGAAIAVREGKHITIEVVSRWVSGAGSRIIQSISYFFSVVICGLLTWAAIKFITFEVQMGGTTFIELPVWIPELIIPVTFGLMTLRYALRLLEELTKRLNRVRQAENPKITPS
ncbi:MAG: TRAP transporter small permease [Desulfobacterales bacterium]|nr:MAG: TRAP transporter small permease [Desulfobacterales bacterium]